MSPLLPIRSAALAASAGTGKTFALSNRYLALLAAGAPAPSIVALTFTRKAAGEILSRILTRLAKAAADDKGNRDLSQELADSRLSGFADLAAAQAALRGLVQALPLLRIGTLDSFFLQILRQFRLEYGIGADLAIAQTQENPEDHLVLQRLLEQKARPADEQRELMETFKLATFGEEKKSVYASIHRLIENQYELIQRAPEESLWGNPARIWQDGHAPAPAPDPDWDSVFDALEAQADSLPPGQSHNAWLAFLSTLQAVRDGSDFAFGSALGDRIYAAFTSPGGIRDSISFGRSAIALQPAAQSALASVFAHIRHALLLRHMVRTRGLHHLLTAYGREHRAHIARTGQLSFNDIAQLLAPTSGQTPVHLRAQMDGRLDARFRHWLLDEFQDTSLVQWAVIENLIDEVIQNPDADRTLFYVGDTKQAIYEWRSGDPRLFRRILDKYNRPGHVAIEVAPPLVRSWRSSPVILDAVNAVFGELPDMPLPNPGKLGDDWHEIAAQWAAEWTPHEAADKNKSLSGHVALHVLPKPKEEGDPTPISRAADLVAELQQDLPDFDRLSVAILTRGNDDGLAMLNALVEKGVHAVWAGNSPLLDNALLPAILSFAKLIEHPGDTLARQHVEMSMLVPALSLAPANLAAWGRLIREQGYAGFAAQLAATLDLAQAPLEQSRLRTLIAVAAEFDRVPDGDALRFSSFVQAQSLPAEHTGSNIQILTMHKAKGLEYDIVLLPALGDKGITSKAKGPLLIREQDVHEPNPPVDWILSSPEKAVIETDPVLAAQLAADRQGKALEELRLLYVAMTRAKRALHLVTTAPGKTSESLRLDTVIQNTLAPGKEPDPAAPVFESGDPTWWKSTSSSISHSRAPEIPPSPPPPCPPLHFSDLPKADAERPMDSHIASQDHAIVGTQAGWLFRPEGADARDFGTRVHALFEQIEWLAPDEMPTFAEAIPADAQLVAAFLNNPAHHAFFERPAGSVELLLEQAFEAVLDGRWLSGKIDRLHLERDADGKPTRARVLDFKTDQAPNPDRHRPQMDDYRKAVSLLFGLPPAQIACTLLFVRSGTIAEL